MLISLIVLVLGLLAGLAAFKMLEDVSARPEDLDSTWERAIAEESSQLGQILMRAARPLSSVPTIYEAGISPRYRALQKKLLAGQSFACSVEVYLAVQAICAFLGVIWMAMAVFGTHVVVLRVAALVFAGALVSYPWGTVKNRAAKRADAVAISLPAFAELLLMPLESGMTPLSAMSFTADQVPGPVSEEVKNLRRVIDSGAMGEAEAFQLAGARLGSPEASSFFTALMHAHLEGGKLVETLATQATALRESAHQRARVRIRKLPIKLVPMFVVFLMPLLFVLALLPAGYSLAHAVG